MKSGSLVFMLNRKAIWPNRVRDEAGLYDRDKRNRSRCLYFRVLQPAVVSECRQLQEV